MPNCRVWVVNKNKWDYSPAEEFGEVRAIFEGRVQIRNPDSVTESVVATLKEATKEDFVVMSGHTFLNMVVGHYFLKRFKQIKVLIWEDSKRKYAPITMFDFDVPRKFFGG